MMEKAGKTVRKGVKWRENLRGDRIRKEMDTGYEKGEELMEKIERAMKKESKQEKRKIKLNKRKIKHERKKQINGQRKQNQPKIKKQYA